MKLLKIVDSLDNLINSLENSPEPLPESYQRLSRAISFVQRKLLSILQNRDVHAITIPENTPVDINSCRIIDSEIRDDLPERSLLKILKAGYREGDKVLRSAEVIFAKLGNLKIRWTAICIKSKKVSR